MYCVNCGAKIEEGNKFCKYCGNDMTNYNVSVTTNDNNKKSNNGSDMRGVSIILGVLGIVGGVMIVFCPIAFILSLIGLIVGIKASKYVKNTLGIILNSIGLFLSFVGILLIGLVVRISVNLIRNLVNEYTPSYNYTDGVDDFNDVFDSDFFDLNDFFGNNESRTDSNF